MFVTHVLITFFLFCFPPQRVRLPPSSPQIANNNNPPFFVLFSPSRHRYLAHPPPPGNNGCALLMLQALILELGCLPNGGAAKFSIPELPGTLRQAKLLLKSRAFINVRDYLAVRDQGQAALRSVMHTSRKSLVQEVRKGKRVPVQEVKKAGLNVLLVNTRF